MIKIHGITIDYVKGFDLVMLMYNLIEFCSNYSEPTRNLWFHSKEKTTNYNADIVNDSDFKSFKYKSEFLGIQQQMYQTEF